MQKGGPRVGIRKEQEDERRQKGSDMGGGATHSERKNLRNCSRCAFTVLSAKSRALRRSVIGVNSCLCSGDSPCSTFSSMGRPWQSQPGMYRGLAPFSSWYCTMMLFKILFSACPKCVSLHPLFSPLSSIITPRMPLTCRRVAPRVNPPGILQPKLITHPPYKCTRSRQKRLKREVRQFPGPVFVLKTLGHLVPK
jgi:hypothetical protein